MNLTPDDIVIVDVSVGHYAADVHGRFIGEPEVITESLPQFPDFICGRGWYAIRRVLAEKGYHLLPTFTKSEKTGFMRLVLVQRSLVALTREVAVHRAILKARDSKEAAVA